MKPDANPESVFGELSKALACAENVDATDVVLDMVRSLTKLLTSGTDRGDLKMLSQALKELRYAFNVFGPYRNVRKVSVFGSARTPPEKPEYQQALDFASRMTRRGWMVITGAGSGIMEAAQGGAGRKHSFGVNIRLPFEQKANDYIAEDPKLVNFKYFFTRKVVFLKETDAVCLLPGGFGTHDESFESLTLVQTGKSELIPIVFLDRPGGSYWHDWKEYVGRHLRDQKLIDADDMNLFEVTDDIEKALDTITSFYRNYHSSRLVRGKLVLRVKRPISDELLDRLNTTFSDILKSGTIERAQLHVDEANEPHTHAFHRLQFAFDRKSFGRLRKLVDVLNENC